ncbi:transposase, partial [Ignavigranum ruoffiae]
MAKYSLEFKMKIVSEYLSGTIGMKTLTKKYKIKSSQELRTWVNAYKTLGIKGLMRSRKNKTYSVNFKLKAITLYEASEKSYQDVANELGLNNPSLIPRWRQEYH